MTLEIPAKIQCKTELSFRWNDEIVQALLNWLEDLNSSYQFKGLDFESDLIKIYNEVRRMMVEKFENSGFGLVSESDKKIVLQEKKDRKTDTWGFKRNWKTLGKTAGKP